MAKPEMILLSKRPCLRSVTNDIAVKPVARKKVMLKYQNNTFYNGRVILY